jgi:hypothetical protein
LYPGTAPTPTHLVPLLHVLTDRGAGRTPRNVFPTLFRIFVIREENGYAIDSTRFSFVFLRFYYIACAQLRKLPARRRISSESCKPARDKHYLNT